MFTTGSQNPPYVDIQPGDLVEAEWANGEFYPGTVDSIISERGIATQVEIAFNDGDHRRCNMREVRFKDRPSGLSSSPRDQWIGELQVFFKSTQLLLHDPYLVTRQWKASLVPKVCITD